MSRRLSLVPSTAAANDGNAHTPEVLDLGEGDAVVVCCGRRVSPLFDSDDLELAALLLAGHLAQENSTARVPLTMAARMPVTMWVTAAEAPTNQRDEQVLAA